MKVLNIFVYRLLLGLILYYKSSIVLSDGFAKGFLNNIIESSIVKDRLSSRWKWEVWDVVPIRTHIYKIYVFNITNPNEVENGEKPILTQLGPYSYKEHRIKFNISVNLDLSVNYERNFSYTFIPSLSNGSEDDLVSVINVPFAIFSSWANEAGEMGNNAVNSLVRLGEGVIKKQTRVGNLLWNGIDVAQYVPYLTQLNLSLKLNPKGYPDQSLGHIYEQFITGKYALFNHKNGANEGRYRVNSGLKDASLTGKIIQWDNELKLNYWYGPTCNALNGTDGTVLPPYVSKDDDFYVYDVDLCRSIRFSYNADDTFQSAVPIYIFKLHETFPNDDCFCSNIPKSCLPKGTLDISPCSQIAPFVASFPHFMNGDISLAQNLIGLNPDPKKHETVMGVQSRLGVVVQYLRRFQLNIDLGRMSNLDYWKRTKVPKIIFPILWNDDNFDLDHDKAELMISELANTEGGYGYFSDGNFLRPTLNFINFPFVLFILYIVFSK